ncbi:hypothetical protein J6590_055875 [Homalodisca vitripennis]|nr:hypothetical protein J6590_055875 [Homalodisca vitripennis]
MVRGGSTLAGLCGIRNAWEPMIATRYRDIGTSRLTRSLCAGRRWCIRCHAPRCTSGLTTYCSLRAGGDGVSDVTRPGVPAVLLLTAHSELEAMVYQMSRAPVYQRKLLLSEDAHTVQHRKGKDRDVSDRQWEICRATPIRPQIWEWCANNGFPSS